MIDNKGHWARGFAAMLFLASTFLAQNMSSRMNQVVEPYVSSGKFMGSVLVARENTILFNRSFGSANLEWGIPNAPTTKFRLASVTKQFTAAAVLLLEERGKLRTEDPIRKYLPEVPVTWEKMTIFHVLTHTAGIPNVQSPTPSIPILTAQENVARVLDRPIDFEPGEKWNYSNNGYILLGYLIEKISGQSYESFIQENIFRPLGMKDSGYDSNSEVIAHRAVGYSPGPTGPRNAPFIHMSVPYAAGALYSTTADLLRWEQGLFGEKLLSDASLRKMTTPFKNDYAFGLQVHSVNGRKVIDHGGGINGFSTMLAYYPEDKLTVVVLANSDGAASEQIAGRLAAVAHGEKVLQTNERREITLDLKVLSRYVGVYQLSGAGTMVISLENNQVSGKLANQAAIPLFPESETTFFAKNVDAQVEFLGIDGRGLATQVIIHQNNQNVRGTRLDDIAAKPIADTATSIEKRIQDNSPTPGSETVVRRLIEELRSGKPNYDLMSPGMAATTRQQLSQLQSALKQRGAVRSISFKGVAPGGADIYEVIFENGSWEYRIQLGPDGRVEGTGIRPVDK